MWKPDVCIYHGSCQDGFGAAWAVWKRWPDCEFAPAIYGKPLPDVTGRNVLMVDFSAKAEHLRASGARSLVVIDHHKTAQAELADLPTFDGSLEALDYALPPSGIAVHFDMERSGAVMAWTFSHGEDAIVPTMLIYVEDRDLWHFQYGDRTRQFCAALGSYPMEFAVWDNINLDSASAFLNEGKAVLRVHDANTKKLLAEAYMGSIDGHVVPMVNAPYNYASDVGNELLTLNPDAPFAATWYRRADGKLQFSLRSTDTRMDVSAIAKAYGGGGHRNAAGFEQESS